jgi:hypothetical protein
MTRIAKGNTNAQLLDLPAVKEGPLNTDPIDTAKFSGAESNDVACASDMSESGKEIPGQGPPSPRNSITDEPQQKGNVVTHVMTDAESSLIQHAYTGPVDWSQVVQVVDDYELMKDPFALPPECAEMERQKKFKYRWLNPMDQEKFGMMLSGSIRYWICNRDNSPEVPSGSPLRDAHGLIRRSGLVLAKMPWALYLMRQKNVWRAAILPTKKGAKDAEGRLEYTGSEGGKLKSGDIIVAEEQVVDEDRNMTKMATVNRVYHGDA